MVQLWSMCGKGSVVSRNPMLGHAPPWRWEGVVHNVTVWRGRLEASPETFWKHMAGNDSQQVSLASVTGLQNIVIFDCCVLLFKHYHRHIITEN